MPPFHFEEGVFYYENRIKKDIEALNATAGDWSLWNDTYYFLKGDNDTYVQDNLADAFVVH